MNYRRTPLKAAAAAVALAAVATVPTAGAHAAKSNPTPVEQWMDSAQYVDAAGDVTFAEMPAEVPEEYKALPDLLGLTVSTFSSGRVEVQFKMAEVLPQDPSFTQVVNLTGTMGKGKKKVDLYGVSDSEPLLFADGRKKCAIATKKRDAVSSDFDAETNIVTINVPAGCLPKGRLRAPFEVDTRAYYRHIASQGQRTSGLVGIDESLMG